MCGVEPAPACRCLANNPSAPPPSLGGRSTFGPALSLRPLYSYPSSALAASSSGEVVNASAPSAPSSSGVKSTSTMPRDWPALESSRRAPSIPGHLSPSMGSTDCSVAAKGRLPISRVHWLTTGVGTGADSDAGAGVGTEVGVGASAAAVAVAYAGGISSELNLTRFALTPALPLLSLLSLLSLVMVAEAVLALGVSASKLGADCSPEPRARFPVEPPTAGRAAVEDARTGVWTEDAAATTSAAAANAITAAALSISAQAALSVGKAATSTSPTCATDPHACSKASHSPQACSLDTSSDSFVI
mmetsp:Transcript_37655/g.83527  ORF Transcript_37655/g.83527 Transcript_37655/m.83527 type:complete len:303 (-) Transcript_37655:1654-2562(-)